LCRKGDPLGEASTCGTALQSEIYSSSHSLPPRDTFREAEAARVKELHAALVIQKVARGFLTRRRLDILRYAGGQHYGINSMLWLRCGAVVQAGTL
jgi:hypothetical protein